jgi:hypothetical protein
MMALQKKSYKPKKEQHIIQQKGHMQNSQGYGAPTGCAITSSNP